MQRLEFRPIEYSEADPLARDAALLVWGALYGGDPGSDPVATYAQNIERCESFCVERDGVLVAAGSVDLNGIKRGRASLEDIVVAENAERQGVGRFLVRNLEHIALEQDELLMCVESSIRAVQFYKRCGYKQVGGRRSTVLNKLLVPSESASSILMA